MASRTAKRRATAVAAMRESLSLFYPERAGQFLCPGCLQYIDDETALTDAHIVPAAAGGRLTTVLCADCNGPFGTRRDKWLGEYIRLLKHDHPTILHEREQRGYFYVGDVKVSGRYGVTDEGTIEFTMWEDRTDPESLKAIPNQFKETVTRGLSQDGPVYEHKRSVTFTVPGSLLYDNRDYVTLGVLTAAYLTWFQAFGYSWALQCHLDKVREQIRTETLTVLPRCFSGAMPDHRFREPWVGFGDVNGELALFAGIADRVVIFPPADAPDLYDRLPQDTLEGSTLRIRRRIPIRPGGDQVPGPAAVMFDNRLVVRPDTLPRETSPLIYVPEKGDVEVWPPVSDREFEKMKAKHPNRGVSIRSSFKPPTRHTGR